MPKVKPIPDNRRGVIPNLCIKDAKKAMEFYKKAFGAEGVDCMTGPGGKVAHAEMTIGTGVIMLNDEFPEWNCLATQNARLFFYCENVDAMVERAVKAGCKLEHPVQDQFWGDRMGNVRDPFGVEWGIATHIQDLSQEQIEKAGQEWMKQAAAAK